jgi:hypothetical protein
MSALTNDALYEQLAADGWPVGDDLFFGAAAPTTQALGAPIRASAHRVTANGTANASATLKSLLSNEAPGMVWLINDGAQTVAVFCAAGEKMNGVANASFAVTAGNAAVFVPIPTQVKRKGGTSGGGTLNWSSALIT